MKKMVFCIVPLIMVLVGCASSGTAVAETKDNFPGKDLDAAKLAEDINAIEAGKAAVSGGTVTFTGGVRLETGLTVPEGVTLDLTADGAEIELRDGAVLTVNGTVNAAGHGDHGKGWVEGSLRVEDGAATINGSGTIYLKSKGRLFNIGSDKGKRQLTLDGVTLVGLPDNDQPLVGIGENGAFVLKSGAVTGNTHTSDEWAGGGGVEVWRGTFTMEGGTISGNSAQGKEGSGGGGVQIGEVSVFTMRGGEISGNSTSTTGKNKTTSEGAGVRLENSATFTMSGGAIMGNTAIDDNNARAGGVWVGEKAVFTMSGGIISGNSASSKTGGAYGGGVVAFGSTFIMTNGTIAGNSSAGKTWNSSIGGGVRAMQGAVFTMSGGTITGNTTSEGGGGVLVDYDSTFTMQGGVISANTATGGTGSRGGGVDAERSGTFIMEGGTIYGNADSLPAGTDPSLANSAGIGASLNAVFSTAKWGTGGAYTKGGASQADDSYIVHPSPNHVGTDDTLIAVP
jgi:hypothetical protein